MPNNKKNFTLQDFFRCDHIVTAKLKQTRQVTEVFDISKHWKILLELPFLATGVALRNLTQSIKVYSGHSQICKEIWIFLLQCSLLTWQKSIVYLDLQSSEQNSSVEPPYVAVTSFLDIEQQYSQDLQCFPQVLASFCLKRTLQPDKKKRSDSTSEDSNIYKNRSAV